MDKQTTEFIEKFQCFENLLKKSTNSDDNTRFSQVLKRASERNSYINKNFYLIEDLYALRNVFSHRERGKYIAKINSFILKEVEKLIKILQNPPTVISKFKVDVYQANTFNDIPTVMKIMREKTYTHVPVWRDNDFIGVFSYTSFFEWLAERQGKENQEITFTKKIMGDIDRRYLNPPSVNYIIIKESTDLYEVSPMFEIATSKNKRLDCLLITPNGVKGEKLTGIITPWDLGSIK